jgi:hypothetical protein
LDVDGVQPELVFLDDSVDPAVAALADCLPCILQRAAVPHLQQKFHDEPLEEVGRALPYSLQQLGGQFFPDLLIAKLDVLLSRELARAAFRYLRYLCWSL